MDKVRSHFFGGALVGAAAAGLIVSMLFMGRLSHHTSFESNLIEYSASVTDEAQRLRQACGAACDGIKRPAYSIETPQG
ncbi:MAG: hypothetical protein AB2814_07955 [Candidatus Sedimenticola endophacoides]